MSVIKQIATYNGSAWTTDDIGANASNVSLSTNVAGQSNVQSALSKIVGTSALTASRAVVTGTGGVLTTSSVTSTQLGYLSGASSNIQTQINTLNTNLDDKANQSDLTTLQTWKDNTFPINGGSSDWHWVFGVDADGTEARAPFGYIDLQDGNGNVLGNIMLTPKNTSETRVNNTFNTNLPIAEAIIGYKNFSIPNKTAPATALVTLTQTITMSGWHPIGIWGLNWSGGATAMKFQTFQLSATVANIYLVNTTTSAVNLTNITVGITYVKDEADRSFG